MGEERVTNVMESGNDSGEAGQPDDGMRTPAGQSPSGLRFMDQVRRNAVAIISLVVAVVALSYNTWRNEKTEHTRNIREAGFLVIDKLSDLQSTVFKLRYGDADEGTVQNGWAEVLAINDLCYAMPDRVQDSSKALVMIWDGKARSLRENENYEVVDQALDQTRADVLAALKELR